MTQTPHSSPIPVVSYASSLAGNCHGTELSASHLQKSIYFIEKSDFFKWIDIPQPQAHNQDHAGMNAFNQVLEQCQVMADHIAKLPAEGPPLLSLGGDHSMGIGTWSGVTARHKGDLGLIWIDAHFDSHTPDTSHSQNIHGMPVATLLGHGAPELTHLGGSAPKIKPENLCFIGVRDFEPEEQRFLDEHHIRYFMAKDIPAHGLQNILQQAIAHVSQHSDHLGISIDLDALDPADAPGVSLPVPHGLRAAELIEALSAMKCSHALDRLVALEISEFCPRKDEAQRTEQLIPQLIESCLPMPVLL